MTDVQLLQRRIIRLEADKNIYRDAYRDVRMDLARATVLLRQTLDCLQGKDAWTRQDIADARKATEEIRETHFHDEQRV